MNTILEEAHKHSARQGKCIAGKTKPRRVDKWWTFKASSSILLNARFLATHKKPTLFSARWKQCIWTLFRQLLLTCVGGQHKDLTAVWLVNGLCMLFPQAYLTENKHVLAFLVRYPVDRLFIVSCHVHFIQVFSETKKGYVSQLICDKRTILALKFVITYTFQYMQIVHHYTYLWIRFHTISEQDSLFVYQYVHSHRDNW